MTDCCELLIAEHRRAEELVGRLGALLQAAQAEGVLTLGDLPQIQTLYEELETDLHRHYALEEKALFPVVSQYRTMMLMEVEHEDLLKLQSTFAEQLWRVASLLEEDALPADSEAFNRLIQQFEAYKTRLLAHMVEEERGIFPLANERLEPEEKLKVLRLTNELIEARNSAAYDLLRPIPAFILKKANLTESSQRPMDYQTLFEREHSSVQTLRLHAGQKQAFHWAGQIQVYVVLMGTLRFEAETETGKTGQSLGVGDTLTVDSRLLFSLSATTEALLLVFKVWPHPHYTKA